MNPKIRFFGVLALVAFGLLVSPLALRSSPAPQAKKIDLNTATQAELESLKGIGPALAQKIISARPFKTVDDLKNVSGIGPAVFEAIKDQVTVGAAKAKTKSKVKSETATKAVETAKAKTPEETKALPKSAAKATSQAAKQTVSGEPIDLNTADRAALEALPGIGPALAGAIIAARPFKSVDDLKNVKGIGQSKFDGIKNLVTVGQEEEAVNPKLMPGQTININTASEEQLDMLLGIGPAKAQAIIAGRPYAKIEDIMKVKGIKEKTFAKIKDYIVVK